MVFESPLVSRVQVDNFRLQLSVISLTGFCVLSDPF